ncbi:MAG: M23 family metallopeptidase [Bacteroidetes bacterium]|nr:M23 family metallopeptidase [Bacteroidota bacterium]
MNIRNSSIGNTIFLFLFVCGMLGIDLQGQTDKYPSDYFRPPLGIPMYLSGTFGELRSNHFHSGMDIKTSGVEGKNVYAIADGYVSRIKVSSGGYGKAIYITHPNGYVSVYGHLQKYNPEIQDFVKAYQYEKESYEVEIFPEKDRLKVTKGEIIAISGNTGSSAGPHLHFEIREEANQQPVNPLLFKSLKIKDYTRPKINEIAIYPVDASSMINGAHDTVYYAVGGWGEEHYLLNQPKIEVSGRIAFGIGTHDLMNEIPNKNGVYSIEMFVDTTQVFGLQMDQLSFSTTRYINSLIDYGYYQQKKRRLVRTEVDTNNLLRCYQNVLTNGIVDFNDSTKHNILFKVQDAYGNAAKLDFTVVSSMVDSSHRKVSEPHQGNYFDFTQPYEISEGNINLSFPANAFYRSFYFNLSIDFTETIFSPVYEVHNRFTPVQKAFSIRIKPDSIPDKLKDKLYLAYSDGNSNDHHGFISAVWEGDYISARSRSLGDYTIRIDTVAPEIIPVNVGEGKDISVQQTIRMKIRDRETGIKNYRGTLNGEWILMEYDPKRQLLTYNYDNRLSKGQNNFTLQIEDILGNKEVYEVILYY